MNARDHISGYYQQHRGKLWFGRAIVLLGVGVIVGMSLGGHTMPRDTPASDPHAGHDMNVEEAPKIWTCSMHPQVRQPNPGLCPICEMDLIPLEPGGETGLREVKITPEAAALMDLRVSPVLREAATVNVRLFGKIVWLSWSSGNSLNR